jgi:hypothetical protein
VTESSPDFYVSFNDVDVSLYGAETTAVVLGQMQRFYVLSGNHEKALVGKSFPECLEYLHAHASELNHRSEPLPPRGSTVADILSAPRARR